jgi:hypothetical protein
MHVLGEMFIPVRAGFRGSDEGFYNWSSLILVAFETCS